MSVRVRLALASALVVLLALTLVQLATSLGLLAGPAMGVLAALLGAAAAGLVVGWLVGHDPQVAGLARTQRDLLARVESVLSAQRQLLADTSHELRTPLTTIRGNLDLLAGDLPAAERADILVEMRQEVDRMARLVRDLLLLAERGEASPVERTPVRLDRLVAQVAERLAGPGFDGGRVELRVQPVLVLGDEDLLRQLVGNLVENALRHASPGPGAVQVSVERRPPSALLVVENDGPELPREALERVFDRFYRLDRARSRAHGGSGLGLAIVRHVAEVHGGRVWAENTGHGVRFSVLLPAEPSWVTETQP